MKLKIEITIVWHVPWIMTISVNRPSLSHVTWTMVFVKENLFHFFSWRSMTFSLGKDLPQLKSVLSCSDVEVWLDSILISLSVCIALLNLWKNSIFQPRFLGRSQLFEINWQMVIEELVFLTVGRCAALILTLQPGWESFHCCVWMNGLSKITCSGEYCATLAFLSSCTRNRQIMWVAGNGF